MKMTLDRVFVGEEDPPCRECGGILKSDTISFGQALIPEVIDRALRVAEECEVLLCIGTTLAVGPVNNMVPRAKYAGAKIAIVNGDPTEMDSLADVVIFGGISQIVPMIVAGIENLTN
jgi:NAD-dependent deacetylase